jgi:hypothetical protein
MAEASILSGYSREAEAAQLKAQRAGTPLGFFGFALAVLVGNLMTGVVVGVIYFLVR